MILMVLPVVTTLHRNLVFHRGTWSNHKLLETLDVTRAFLVVSLVRLRVSVEHTLVDLTSCVSTLVSYEQ